MNRKKTGREQTDRNDNLDPNEKGKQKMKEDETHTNRKTQREGKVWKERIIIKKNGMVESMNDKLWMSG